MTGRVPESVSVRLFGDTPVYRFVAQKLWTPRLENLARNAAGERTVPLPCVPSL